MDNAGMHFDLDDAALFLRVAELGTLSAAARERNWPASQASRTLARLEAALGVRLVHRSTHGLSLTDEGDTFARHARRLMATRDELAADLGSKLLGPSGWVRVGVSPALAEAVIAPSLAGLYARHPQLHIDLAADDRMADMAREGIDIALRTGSVHSDLLVARQIGDYGRTLCASPAYLARHGTPRTLDDLTHHRLIASSVSPALNLWPLALPEATGLRQRRAEPVLWPAQGHTRSDNSAATLALVLHGVGLARLSDLVARSHIASGALVPLLPGVFDPQRVPVYAVMLQERHRLPKVRACIDWWQQWLAGMPDNTPQPTPP
jgi:DNA-binding transcriptional LysR family regulator